MNTNEIKRTYKIQHLIFCILFVLLSSNVFSQDSIINKKELKYISKKIIKVNPFGILAGPIPSTSEYRLMLESHISSKNKIQIGASYLSKNIFWLLNEMDSSGQGYNISPKIRVSGYRAQIYLKHYFTKHIYNYQGLYIAPYITYSKVKFYVKDYNSIYEEIDAKKLNYSMIAGFQKKIGSRLFIDTYSGFAYRIIDVYDTYNSVKTRMKPEDIGFTKSRFSFLFGFNLGFMI